MNGGYPGDRIPACVTKWNNARASGAHYSTLVWSCGVNSFSIDVTGAAAWALVEPVLAQAKTDGLKVIITEVMPWKGGTTGWTAGRSAEADAYFSLAQSWCASNSENCIATKASMGGQGGDPNVLLAAFDSGDNIHPSVAGQLQLATLVNAASP